MEGRANASNGNFKSLPLQDGRKNANNGNSKSLPLQHGRKNTSNRNSKSLPSFKIQIQMLYTSNLGNLNPT